MAASVSSSTSLVRKWRTAFLTLRDETLTSPPTSTVLHHIIFYQLDTLIAASPHLPPHEVLTDTKFLMELGGTISIWEEGDADMVHIFSQLSHLIHNVSRHVSFEVTSSLWALVLDCYGKLFEMFFGKACTKRIFLGNVNVVRTLEQFLETLRCVSTVYQRTSSLSENTLLLNFLLSIASRFQTELIDSSHTSVSWMRGSESGNRASGSYSSWEVQTNAFTMISEVYLRVGTYLPVDHWQSTVEVFRKVMDVLAAKGLLLEDNILAKYPYHPLISNLSISHWWCFYLQVAGFVAALRMFFNYGLTHKSQTVLIVTSQKEDTATSLNTNLTYSGPYKPPYLRKKDQKLLQLIEPDSMVFSYHEFSSVDHMLSDSDYSDSDGSPKEAFNITSSKARVVAIVCLQVTQELFVCKQEGNNSLENYREFVAIFVHLKKLGNDDHLHKAFAFFDHNKNRYIEIEELREALADEVDTNSEEVINAIIQDVDTDKA